MKTLTTVLIILLAALAASAQTDAERADWAKSVFDGAKISSAAEQTRILTSDFAPMWVRLTDNQSVLGYIGDDYQRMRIVILTAIKQPGHPDTYDVTGKSMVKNVIRPFAGTIKITKTATIALDEDYQAAKVKEAGLIFGEYHFAEDAKQTNTGEFDGSFVTNWVIDERGRLRYDDVIAEADGWSNDQFAGTWTSYRTKTRKPASWGDSRIPLAGELDMGAGEFSPSDKYLNNGWQNYRDAYSKGNKRAVAEEKRRWWN